MGLAGSDGFDKFRLMDRRNEIGRQWRRFDQLDARDRSGDERFRDFGRFAGGVERMGRGDIIRRVIQLHSEGNTFLPGVSDPKTGWGKIHVDG
jgi:hypothetical protein